MTSQAQDALSIAVAEVKRLKALARRESHALARSAELEALALFVDREDPTGPHRRCECGALITTWILRPVSAGGTGGERIRCDNGHDCSARFVVVSPKRVIGSW